MRTIFEFAIITILLAFISCEYPSSTNTTEIIPSSNQIWVAQFYSGGVQCDTSNHYTPPDIKSILTHAGVYVADTDVEPYAVCEACSCPAYAAMHYALIRESDLERAQRIGFRPRPLPWLFIRTQRVQYACTDTLNFTITNFTRYDAYLPSCGSRIHYWIEIRLDGQWYEFASTNTIPCNDTATQMIQIRPYQKLNQRLPLSSIENLVDAKYRIKMVYHFDTMNSIRYAYSNPFSVTCPSDSSSNVPRALYGSWNWVKSQGGIAGVTITPASAGYTRKVVYNPNMTYEWYKNDSLEVMSAFSIYYITESPLDTFPVIHYDSLPEFQDKMIYSLKNDTLVLSDRCIDCFVHTYVKVPTSPRPIPFTNISVDCINRVSSGGYWKGVVNTQLEYDNLIYKMFQQPLDEYWNSNFENMLEHAKEEYPGLTDSEYVEIVTKRFYEIPPFLGTANCTIPTIDFSHYTLLGMGVNGGGCSIDHIPTVTDSRNGHIVFKVNIYEHGSCEMGWSFNEWVIIPKISQYQTILFQKNYIRD
jgi:hypothetical protein